MKLTNMTRNSVKMMILKLMRILLSRYYTGDLVKVTCYWLFSIYSIVSMSIKVMLTRYYTGDLVNVTCYSRGSSPPANLHWKVNNERVFDEAVADMEQYRCR